MPSAKSPLLAALMFVALGCGHKEIKPSPPAPVAVPGWVNAGNSKARFKMQLPGHWSSFDLSSKTLKSDLTAAIKSHPYLAAQRQNVLDNAQRPERLMIALGAPVKVAGAAYNPTILVAEAKYGPKESFTDFVTRNLTDLKAAASKGSKPVREKVKVGTRDGERVSTTIDAPEASTKIDNLVYFVSRGDTAYVITFMTPQHMMPKSKATFEKMAGTIQLP